MSGRVTFVGGQAVEHGMIEFSNTAAVAGSPIATGNYAIAADKGLPPGTYLVRIYASKLVNSDTAPPGPRGQAPPAELVAKEYNTQSQLKFEVLGTENIVRDFEVKGE